jgi:hypothetical protein
MPDRAYTGCHFGGQTPVNLRRARRGSPTAYVHTTGRMEDSMLLPIWPPPSRPPSRWAYKEELGGDLDGASEASCGSSHSSSGADWSSLSTHVATYGGVEEEASALSVLERPIWDNDAVGLQVRRMS